MSADGDGETAGVAPEGLGREAEAAEERLIRQAVARLRAGIMATVVGLLAGAALFFATAWLVVRGGPNVGMHLSLLRHYFPGYSVTWPGAFVGFFWAGLSGAVTGWVTAWIYNLVAERRHDELR